MTQTTQTHTATPWTAGLETLKDSNGLRVCAMLDQSWKPTNAEIEAWPSNAAFIVEAVNSHARLLSENKAMREALGATVKRLVDHGESVGCSWEYDNALKALAKAEANNG